MIGWQPIETAPTDGTWFIAFEHGDTYPCQWREDEPDGDGGVKTGGWYDFLNGSCENPSAWHPVPSVHAPRLEPSDGC